MQSFTAGAVKPKATEILSAPPRSGTISVYAQKLTAQAFVWLCCFVVWGNIANHAVVRKQCTQLCIVQILCATLAWLWTTVLLGRNYMTEGTSGSQTRCFSNGMEAPFTFMLVLLFTVVVGTTSNYNGAPIVATWFAWLGFFGSMYATYKAYHWCKEEDLPSSLPDGYDEESYVYG